MNSPRHHLAGLRLLVFCIALLIAPVAPLAARPAAAIQTVSVADFAFTPALRTAIQGDTVQWNFGGPTTHTASDTTGLNLFDSGFKAAGTNYSKVFPAAATYAYHCNIHTSMLGTVSIPPIVSPATGTVATT